MVIWLGLIFEQNLTARHLQFLRNKFGILLQVVPNDVEHNLYFQLDGCPPHNARITREYLDTKFREH